MEPGLDLLLILNLHLSGTFSTRIGSLYSVKPPKCNSFLMSLRKVTLIEEVKKPVVNAAVPKKSTPSKSQDSKLVFFLSVALILSS